MVRRLRADARTMRRRGPISIPSLPRRSGGSASVVERVEVSAHRGAEMVRSLLPVGGTLPVDTWESRHRGIRTLLWLPVPGLFLFALARGKSRRRAERALRSSQARTQPILAAANDAFVEMDVSGVITDWNRSAEVMFGWTSQEAVGRVLSETIIPVEFRPMHEAGFRRFLATGEGPRLGPRVQVPVLHRDGHQFPAELSVWLTGEPGNYSFNALVQDITEEKRDQEKLQETLSLLGATLEATADGLLVVDRSGRMTSSNRKFAEMWGLPASVIESGDADAAVAAAVPHLEDPDAFVGEIRRMADLPEAESHDTLHFRDGRVFERYSKPQRVDGVAVGRVWSFHDVSDLKALEVDLAEARDRALESSRVKSEFLATMSHEIRTPMNGVIGLTGLLLDTDLDESQRQYAEGVQASGEALLGLSMTSWTSPRSKPARWTSRWSTSTSSRPSTTSSALVAEPAGAKSLELVVDCPPHLPATVCGDVGRLRQVLLNLLSNAIKFTDAGEVVLRASTVGAAGPDRVTMRFEVADTGIGIDAATTRAALRALLPGRRLHHPPLRRNGPRPGHLSPNGRGHGRQRRSREPARSWQHVLAQPPARAPRRAHQSGLARGKPAAGSEGAGGR